MLKKNVFPALLLVMAVGFSNVVLASSGADVKAAMGPLRDSLLTMLKNADKRGPEQQKAVKETAGKVSQLIKELKVPADKESVAAELKSVWNEFNKVREEKVVPAILAGNTSEAEKLANGEQKQRLMKIMQLCDQLK
ncbi:MAG TPA: hypothetical protein PLS67_07635 [Accumulibacter sp.]|jgi:hypothetical protein|nr:hypothetical protein [Accumulibacter sp.]HQC80378.1 hypothetical protein [Accumulibacter sp.]